MAKKVHVKNCKTGSFYLLSGWDHLFFCLYSADGRANFQQVGSDFRVTVMDEKVKPVNVYMFSK